MTTKETIEKAAVEKKINDECQAWAIWPTLSDDEKQETIDGYWTVYEMGLAHERERAKVLVEALEFYAAPIEGKINSSHIDMDFYDVENGDSVWTGGKKAREALAKYRESLDV